MARVQTNTNLGGGERPQPMASPRGISAPVATVGESGLMGLARSLSGLRPQLNQYLEESKADYQEQEAARAYDTIQGMTYEEARAAVEAGTMRGTESPWFRAAFQKQFGLAHAANRRREIVTAYNTEFDKQGGDLDAFLASYAQADYEAYGDSEFIAAGIREGMQGTFEQIKNTQAQFLDAQLQTKASEQFYTIARDTVQQTASAGGDVNAAIASVVSQHTAAGLIDQDKADAALMGLAEEFALQGDTVSVAAVLNADPYGRGSFASRGGFSTKAAALSEQAKAVAADTGRKASINERAALELRARTGRLDEKDQEQISAWVETGLMTADAAEGLKIANDSAQTSGLADATEANLRSSLMGTATDLILRGSGASVQDTVINLPNGTTKTITGKELREGVVNEQMTALLSGENPSVAVAAQHMASWGLAETFKPWADAMSNGYVALTGALTKPDPTTGKVTIPPAAAQGYSLWRELSGADKVREMHVKDSTAAAIYRDAETLEEIGGWTPEEALTAAASIDRKASRTSLSSRVDSDTFTEAVAGHMKGGLFSASPVNAQIVSTAVEEHARILMDLNIPQDKAIQKALEAFDSSFTLVNGVYVNTRDRVVPSDIEAIATGYVEDFLKAHPDEDEAYFVPDRNQDYWTFTDQWGAPLRNAPRIHVSQLPGYLSARKMEEANAAIAEKQ